MLTTVAKLFNMLFTCLKREYSLQVLHQKKQSNGATKIWDLGNHLKLNFTVKLFAAS